MARTIAGTALILPTLNAERHWSGWIDAYRTQTQHVERVLVIDSDSTDATCTLAASAGFRVHQIRRADFNHGGTRQLAADLLGEMDTLIYMTQDAILAAPESLERILEAFRDSKVGAAYGRQLPRPGAAPVEAHARLYNYEAVSKRKRYEDVPQLGFKATFLSDSFSAYRASTLRAVGGFPKHILFGEDAHVAGRMLLAGHEIQYCAEATVFHSHAYSWGQEFRRYFDVGAFHAAESWLRRSFGPVRGEGLRFVRSELRYLSAQAPAHIPSAIVRTALKYGGYQLGLRHRYLPRRVSARLSMFPPYWKY